MRRIAIDVDERTARRALRDLGNEETGPYIARGCRCVGCRLLRQVRDALAAAQKEEERG